MRILCIVLLLNTCSLITIPEKQSIDLKEQFNKCRDSLYTNYPNQIKQSAWRICMQKKGA